MGELHGTKALIFLMFIVGVLGGLVAAHIIASEVFMSVVFISLGYAFGNTVLKKHNKIDRDAIACSHTTCNDSACLCPCHGRNHT